VNITPPLAKQLAHQTEDGRIDLYHWLKEKQAPAVLDYLKAENEYAKQILESTDAMQEKIFQEIRGRMKETDSSAPWRMKGATGDFLYYFRTEEAQQYRIFCRKRIDGEHEEILIDENELAKHHNYFHLNAYAISPNQQFLAYTVDTQGDEYYHLVIKDLMTHTILSDDIQAIGDNIVFTSDNLHIWYIRLDSAHRPYQIWQHELNTPAQMDKLIFHETDDRFFISASRTKDDQFMLIDSHSKISSEIHYTDAHTLTLPVQCLYKREPNIEYHIEHHKGDFIISTNENARNFQIVRVPVATPEKNHWQVLVAHDETVAIEAMEMMQDFLVVQERRDGLPALHVLNLTNNDDYLIDFPESTYSVDIGDNWLTDSHLLRFDYESLTTPHSTFDFDLVTKTRTLVKQKAVLGDYHPDNYISERLFATADDGTQIPISCVYKKGLKKPAPTYLMGYGAYGAIYDPWFSHARLSLLDRGFIFAIAHIRGGGEYGKPWHDAGKLFKKQNTFTDFIAIAKHLIATQYTSAAQLIINGGSAGGLLMGAVLNQRPDLFAGCIAHVPFVDVLNTLQDPSLPLSITEYEEWGNPNDRDAFEYIATYSPYDNIQKQAYPALLVTAGLTDWRVPYWEAAKWVAKLRTHKTDENLLLLKTELESGHFGLSGRYNMLREVALEYAFIFKVLNI
jgi:oligopeptidase B